MVELCWWDKWKCSNWNFGLVTAILTTSSQHYNIALARMRIVRSQSNTGCCCSSVKFLFDLFSFFMASVMTWWNEGLLALLLFSSLCLPFIFLEPVLLDQAVLFVAHCPVELTVTESAFGRDWRKCWDRSSPQLLLKSLWRDISWPLTLVCGVTHQINQETCVVTWSARCWMIWCVIPSNINNSVQSPAF